MPYIAAVSSMQRELSRFWLQLELLLHREREADALMQKNFGITHAKIAWIIRYYKSL